MFSKDGERTYQLVDAVLLEAGDLLVCRRPPSCRLGEVHILLECVWDLQFVPPPRIVSGGGGGDVNVLCEEQRILEVVSNVLRLYVGVESERASASCAVYVAQKVPPSWWRHCMFCRRGGTLSTRARVSAGSPRGAGRAVRREASSNGAGEGAGESASAA